MWKDGKIKTWSSDLISFSDSQKVTENMSSGILFSFIFSHQDWVTCCFLWGLNFNIYFLVYFKSTIFIPIFDRNSMINSSWHQSMIEKWTYWIKAHWVFKKKLITLLWTLVVYFFILVKVQSSTLHLPKFLGQYPCC